MTITADAFAPDSEHSHEPEAERQMVWGRLMQIIFAMWLKAIKVQV